jgi:hypothetical protein
MRSTAVLQPVPPASIKPNALSAVAGLPPSRKMRAQACRA